MAFRADSRDDEVFCIEDLKNKASKKIPKVYSDYFNMGAMDMRTLVDNEAAFDRYRIRPRILRNISDIDTSTTIWGSKVAFPFGFSPAAMHGLAHPDGELATSRACARMHVPMGLSTFSNYSLEEVIQEGKGTGVPYAMQISILKKRDISGKLLRRAEAAGYKAILLTVDAPVLGRRLNEFRNKFEMPSDMTYPNLWISGEPPLDTSTLAYENGIEWEEAVAFIKKHTTLPVWLKGIYTAEDVTLAIQHGIGGIIISNHGGRQLDSVPATLDALRECAPVAKGKIPIAIDGGIRRGNDIFKAIALGADFCFAGRIPIWGLGHNGQKGVELAINLLHDEFKLCMGLTGCKSVAEIHSGYLSILQPDGLLSKL